METAQHEPSEIARKLNALMYVLDLAFREGDIEYSDMVDIYTDTALVLYKEEYGSVQSGHATEAQRP